MSAPNDIQALLASIRPRPLPTSMTGHGYGHDPDAPNTAAPPPPQYPPQYTAGFSGQQQQQQGQQQHHHLHQPQHYDGQAFPFAAAAHLRQQQHQQHQQQQLQGGAMGYRHPSVTTIHSPLPLHNTPPHRGSDILSPNVSSTPRGDMFPEQNPDRAVNLLSLLKSNQGAAAAATATSPAPVQQPSPAMPLSPQDQETGLGDEAARQSHARNISASDLVASLFGGGGGGRGFGGGGGGGGRQAPTGPALVQPTAVPAGFPYEPQPGSSVRVGESPSSATPNSEKEMLLRLLNRTKPAQDVGGDGPGPAKSMTPSSASPARSPVPDPFLRGARQLEETVSGKPDVALSSEPTSLPPKESLFTYVNPFEQLAAASPRNRTPQPKSRSASPAVDFLNNPKLNVAAKMEPPAATAQAFQMPPEPERSESPVLADEQREAISDVVGQMVEQIGREIDGTSGNLAEEKTPVPPVSVAREENTQEVLSSIADNLRETAAEAKQEPAEETVKEFVQEEVTATTTTTTTAVPVKETTQSKESSDALPDNWESSAEDTAAKEEGRVVYVHNFPLKPFISIVVRPNTGKLASLRDDGIMDIARLKKEFDQLDRSLTSATSEYIVYALAKNGGMRIIRQDDGSDKQVFRSTRDRVFNVALSTSQPAGGALDEQAILGIGVSGTVYWALVSRPEKDLFELDALESESLVFPPFPASDENTSGGQLKTRAKRSSRHPGFFAIGRGKNIYVISPHAAMNAAYGVSGTQRTVNTEKFFKERALKISTGKAGKDFMFSDDDTVIASLDKTGRLRFWDIRDVANNSAEFFANNPNPAEVRVALSTFVTGSPAEKSWPTSVLFIDKLRPYIKSIALRYVLVGLKQNHTLQLWDIGLGKAVQELKFPHENESDAICSVAYHAASGIIVIGHPTRNSIYFVHLSAPRYMLPSMSQASFIKRASEKDTSLPKPESTACMSGIREISFASKGQLRSLELLPINKSVAAGDKRGLDEGSGLFELYVMHSRGVTCLNIQKEDLGWSADNRIMHPVNALSESLIEINDLETFPAPVTDDPSINGDTSSTPTKVAPKEAVAKKASEVAAEAAGAGPSRTQSPTKPALKKKSEEPVEPAATAVPTNGSEKPEKKKKRKGTGASVAASGEGAPKVKDVAFTEPPGELPRGTPTAKATGEQQQQPNGNELHPSQSISTATPGVLSSGGSNEFWNKHMETLQSGVSSEFNKSLGREIEGLYTRFDEERRLWDARSTDRQDQILRLVSSTLSDNVEKNLARIVFNSIQTEVVPAITDSTFKQLNDVVARQLGGMIPREMHQTLPQAVSRAVQQPDVLNVMSEAVAQRLGSQVEGEVSKALHSTINPAVKNLTLRAAEKIGADTERQVQAQIKQLEVQRHNDSAKIDQLTTLVRGLSDTVAAMAATQTGFQNEVLRLNHALNARQGGEGRQSAQPSVTAASASPSEARTVGIAGTAEDIELAEVAQLMNQGRFEEGSVKVCI